MSSQPSLVSSPVPIGGQLWFQILLGSPFWHTLSWRHLRLQISSTQWEAAMARRMASWIIVCMEWKGDSSKDYRHCKNRLPLQRTVFLARPAPCSKQKEGKISLHKEVLESMLVKSKAWVFVTGYALGVSCTTTKAIRFANTFGLSLTPQWLAC